MSQKGALLKTQNCVGMQRRRWLGVGVVGVAAFVVTSLLGCATPALPVAQALPGAAPAADVMRIGLGSCMNQKLPQPLWQAVLNDKPDLFVFGGDTVYAEERPFTPEGLKQAYAQQAAVAGFAQLRAAVPHMALWDDHDYGKNDGGGEFAFKNESREIFLNFWNVAAQDPRRAHGGVYHAQTFGAPGRRVQVILLDMRWARSPWKRTDQRDAPGRERYVSDDDPGKTMLGDEQWRWLESQLREPAQVRVIVSGVQILTEGHGWERWGLFPRERQRLIQLLAPHAGVVLVSGDRHFGALYQDRMGMPYTLTELTTSGITHSWKGAKEAGPNRVGDLFDGLNYGMLEVDWAKAEVRMLLKDAQGAVQRRMVLPLSSLQAQP